MGLAVGSGLEAEVREGERVDRMRAWARVAAYSQAMLMEQIAALHAVRDPAPHRHNPPARSAGGAAPGPAEGLASALFLPVEVAQALRLGARTAEHLVADAVALSARLPATADALRDGSIDAATARAIVDETALLTDQDVMATVEAAGLRRARTGGGTARAVRMHTRRQALRHDPANAARRVQAALGDVGVDKGDLLDGVGDLKVTLTAVDRAAVWTSLTDHAHAQRSTPGERRTLSQLRAAALVDLTTRPWLFTHPDTGDQAQADPTRDRDGRPLRLHRHPDHRHRDRHRDLQHRDHQHRDHRAADHEDGPATGTADEGMDQDTSKRPSTTTRSTRERSTRERSTRERSTSPPGSSPPRSRRSTGPWKVDVIVDLTTLLGANDDPALLVGHGLIPAAAARELAADGTWRRLVTDPLTGAVVERSTIRYRPTTTLADHVNARDQHCQMPGCRQPAGACDIDHRTSYRHGGTTCPDNLWALCRHHHRCKHSPGWTLTRHPGGATSVTTPTHHTYTAPPPTPWD